MTASAAKAGSDTVRLYSLCFFDRGWVVPQVQFLEAEDDEAALNAAVSMKPWMTREVWDRYRLVSVMEPTKGTSALQRAAKSQPRPNGKAQVGAGQAELPASHEDVSALIGRPTSSSYKA